MKIQVTKQFLDFYNGRTVYKPGEIITVTDEARARDIVARGLGKACTSGNDSVKAEGKAAVKDKNSK